MTLILGYHLIFENGRRSLHMQKRQQGKYIVEARAMLALPSHLNRLRIGSGVREGGEDKRVISIPLTILSHLNMRHRRIVPAKMLRRCYDLLISITKKMNQFGPPLALTISMLTADVAARRSQPHCALTAIFRVMFRYVWPEGTFSSLIFYTYSF